MLDFQKSNILYIQMLGIETYDMFLAQGEEIIAQYQGEATRKESREVVDAIKGLLGESSLSLEDLAGIVVVHGVGSFTSTRIAAVTANTLGYALNLPILGLKVEGNMGYTDLITLAAQADWSQIKPGVSISPEYGREPNIN